MRFKSPRYGLTLPLLMVILAGEIACISISQGPMDRSVVEGETVILRCEVRNKGTFKVYWYFDATARYLSADTVFFEDARDPRFSIVGNQANGVFNLRISSVRRSDAGIYRCGFVPLGSATLRDVSARLTVLVSVPPRDGFPRCEVSPPVGMIAINQRATLTCTSEGGIPPASLTWLKNGIAITSAALQRNVIERLFDSALNGVEFTCQAKNQAGVRTCSVVPLRIDPTARVEPPQLVANPGEDVMFKCLGDGLSPIVEFSWTFGAVSVSSFDEGDRFELSLDRMTLTIRNVQLADDMTSVQCTVATQNGLTATAGALLRVLLVTNNPTDAITTAASTTMTPTTLTPNPNQTLPLPTPEYKGSVGSGRIIGIIIGAIAAAQIVIVFTVFIAHRLLSKYARHPDMSNVPTLAGWTGQQAQYPPGPYQGLDATDRSAGVFRYLTLHPLRAPPSRHSCADVGVYEAAAESTVINNTNIIVYESGYVQHSAHDRYRDSMDDLNNIYQPTSRRQTESAATYEQPRETVIDGGTYYEQPGQTPVQATTQPQGTYYEPPPETNETPSSDEEDDLYETPPTDQQQTDSSDTSPPILGEQRTGVADDEEAEYCEPPVEAHTPVSSSDTSQPILGEQRTGVADDEEAEYCEPPMETQTPVRISDTSAHVYDVAPDDEDEYEIPTNSDGYVQQD